MPLRELRFAQKFRVGIKIENGEFQMLNLKKREKES